MTSETYFVQTFSFDFGQVLCFFTDFLIKLIQNYTFSVGISLPLIYSILISFSFSFPPSYSCAILHIWLEYCQSMHFLGMLVVTQLINSILMCRFEGSPAYSLMRCHPVKRPNSALPLHDKFSYKKRENKDPQATFPCEF